MKNSKKRELYTLACCFLLLCASCKKLETVGSCYYQFDDVENKGEETSSYEEIESSNGTNSFELTAVTVIGKTMSTVTTTADSVQQGTEVVTQTAYVADLSKHKVTNSTLNVAVEQNVTEAEIITEIPTSTEASETELQTETESNETQRIAYEIDTTGTSNSTEDSNVLDNGGIVENTEAIETSENQTESNSNATESTTYDVLTTDSPETVGGLPRSIQDKIVAYEQEYPGIDIAMGIFSLDGSVEPMTYNENMEISGACTVKAAYAMYVLCKCEELDIDIYTKELEYKESMRNEGSGEIKYMSYGTTFTVSYLLEVLLGISDNTAYNILLQEFPLQGFQTFLNSIGGQNLRNLQYGNVTVMQRKNEWFQIYSYINSGSRYSYVLRQDLTNTAYCYLTEWMSQYHNYMHKSGWCYGKSYTSASDCAIIDGKYLIVVLTQDYSTGKAHTDVVKDLGATVESYMNGF